MTAGTEKWREYGARIEQYVRPATFPLSMRILARGEAFPEKCRRPRADFGFKIFPCQAIKMARHYGWTLGLDSSDSACLMANRLLGWTEDSHGEAKGPAPDFGLGLYHRSREVGQRQAEAVSSFSEPNGGIVISPLARTHVTPSLLAIYCNPAQVMRLTQGYLYDDGEHGKIESECSGKAGTCHDGIVRTLQTQRPRIVVPGNGDRVWGMTQDHEMLFTVPASGAAQLIFGLQETHKAGLRYPVPAYMKWEPGFQADFERRALARAGGTIRTQD